MSLLISKRFLKITAIIVIAAIVWAARMKIIGASKELLSYFPALGWIEIGAGLAVAIGCGGEWTLLLLKEPDEHDKTSRKIRHGWEVVFMSMVALGVTVEVPCLMIGLRESAKLNKEAAQLRLRLQPRVITAKQIKDFMFLTEHIPKIPVRIDVGNGVFNQEAANFAYQLREMFELAKFTVPESDMNYSMHVFNEPTRTYISTDAPTDLIMFTENRLIEPNFEIVNGIKRPIANSQNTNEVYAALLFALQYDGISIGLNQKPEWIKDTHMEIFVRERP